MPNVPLSGTQIRFMSGVPFSNDYKHTRWHTSQSTQTQYFNSMNTVHTMSNASFQRIEGRNYVKVDKNKDELWGINYFTFINQNKRFYGFVTTMEFMTPGLTHVYFEIDVLQTWMFDMNFKPSYVVREHRRLWNNDGTPVINTIDEGLHYGTDYDVKEAIQVSPDPFKWLVIASKKPIATGDEYQSSIVGTPQPLTYYIVPFKDDDTSPNVMLGDSNTGISLLKVSDVLERLYKVETAVNNIVSIYVTDFIGLNHTYNRTDDVITFPNNSGYKVTHVGVPDSIGRIIEVVEVRNFVSRNVSVTNNKYKLKDVDVSNVKESKLLMYPYTVLVLDDFKGNRQEIKLEYLNKKEIRLLWKGSIGTSNFNSVAVEGYNRDDTQRESHYTSNEDALMMDQPNEVPILADMLSAYLQGERNSIKNKRSQIQFNGILNSISSALPLANVRGPVGPNSAGVAQSLTQTTQAMGNSVYDLQAINAKIADINNIPPQLQKMGSNTAYNYGNRYNGVYLMIKQIKPEYKKILEDFFHMFGYKTNEIKVPNFRTRQHFNYVQTSNCNITGNFNNNDLQTLKNIFDNGVTLWHTNDVGNYSLSNGVR